MSNAAGIPSQVASSRPRAVPNLTVTRRVTRAPSTPPSPGTAVSTPTQPAESPTILTRNTTSSAVYPVSAKLAADQNTVIGRRYGSLTSSSTPAAISFRRLRRHRSPGGGTLGLDASRQPAEIQKLTALPVRAVTAPTTWATSPARPGPAKAAADALPCILVFASIRSAAATTDGR